MFAKLVSDSRVVDAIVGNARPIGWRIDPAVGLIRAGGVVIIRFHSDGAAIDGTPSAAGRSAEKAIIYIQPSIAGRPGIVSYPAAVRCCRRTYAARCRQRGDTG